MIKNKKILDTIDKYQFINNFEKAILKQMDVSELIIFLDNKSEEYFKIHNYEKWWELYQTDDYVFSQIDDYHNLQCFLIGKDFENDK